MSAAYFIPLDPVSFFANNDFGEQFYAPDWEGVRFPATCLGCGKATEDIVHLVGGYRLGIRGSSYEQPARVCSICSRLRSHHRTLSLATWVSASVLAVAMATAATYSARVVLGISEIAALAGWCAGIALLLLPTRIILIRLQKAIVFSRVKVDGVAMASYNPVDLYYFRDPRKGVDARIICLMLHNDELAQEFASLNPHAIPEPTWNASYK